MPQNQQNTVCKNSIKHYNQFRSIKNEALMWLQITTYTGKKNKVETEAKQISQQIIYFIKIANY